MCNRLTYQVVGATDVLKDSVKNRTAIVVALHEIAQKLSHQSHIGDVSQEQGHIRCRKHHCTLRTLPEEWK